MYYIVLLKENIMSISLRVSTEDEQLIKQYAEIHNMSVSEFVRKAVFEKIGDELDLITYKKAMQEYQADPQTFSHAEVKRMLLGD